MKIHSLIKYFRQSIIDSERLDIKENSVLAVIGAGKPACADNSYLISRHSLLEGKISLQLVEKLVAKRARKKNSDSIEVLLIPRIDLLKSEGGEKFLSKPKTLTPLIISAKVNKAGELLPSDKPPFIPRTLLEPNESTHLPISHLATIDKFISENPYDEIDTWGQLLDYCDKLVVDSCYQKHKKSLFDVELNDEYVNVDGCVLIDEENVIASQHIKKAYEQLLSEKKIPSLLAKLITSNDAPCIHYVDRNDNTEATKYHVGQMTGEFPLADKQRNALHYLHTLTDGNLLAVNGPPGTGKTTLIRSVVADMWTQSAIDQTQPPLIFATSNNNQAVTNILDSFGQVAEQGLSSTLLGRWLPEIDSYGLYCCSGSAKNKGNYQYCISKENSTILDWENSTYYEKAKSYFLEKASHWAGTAYSSIENVKQDLHNALLSTQVEMLQAIATFELHQKYVHNYGTLENLAEYLSCRNEQLNELQQQIEHLKDIFDNVLLQWGKRGFFTKLLLWLPIIKRGEEQKTQRSLLRHDIHLEQYDDDFVSAFFSTQLLALNDDKKEQNSVIKSLEQDYADWKQVDKNLRQFFTYYKFDLEINNLQAQLNEVCDCHLRFKMFKLATHYWEASWLIELKDMLDKDFKDANSPEKIKMRFRRYAKLTPCFVSTFYMIPKFLTGVEKDGDNRVTSALFEEIDLLIIDESGQATPHIASASFAFAKKALVVGDTDQIEPVWSIPNEVDIANLKAFELMQSANELEFWKDAGLMAGCGNLMRVAQRQTNVQQFERLQRGLYLTEHHRCYDKIIQFNNELIYQGTLEAKRGSPKNEMPFDEMAFIHHSSESKRFGGSRGNQGEADAIAKWLLDNKQKIIDYAKQQDASLPDEQVLSQSVGIITPFKQQEKLIRTALANHYLPTNITVGTVHSLQGAERLIVIFSSVYGSNDRDTRKFYDMKPNMLNVAVSRAKDMFIVFGHEEVFGISSSNTPSAVLRRHLKL